MRQGQGTCEQRAYDTQIQLFMVFSWSVQAKCFFRLGDNFDCRRRIHEQPAIPPRGDTHACCPGCQRLQLDFDVTVAYPGEDTLAQFNLFSRFRFDVHAPEGCQHGTPHARQGSGKCAVSQKPPIWWAVAAPPPTPTAVSASPAPPESKHPAINRHAINLSAIKPPCFISSHPWFTPAFRCSALVSGRLSGESRWQKCLGKHDAS